MSLHDLLSYGLHFLCGMESAGDPRETYDTKIRYQRLVKTDERLDHTSTEDGRVAAVVPL